MTVRINVNGDAREVTSEPDTPLLYVLRNDLGLKGTRFGCGEGTCGACMVLLDGAPAQSCDVPLSAVDGRKITTVEGLADDSSLHRLQPAFIDEQAAQCGYCTSGILMSAAALIDRSPSPSREEIRLALDPNLCRCGSHWRMLRAVERAAGRSTVVGDEGYSGYGPTIELDGDPDRPGIGNDYLTVMSDGTVRMTSGKVDIGQGITTALAQIAADELGVSIERIRIVRADTSFSPNEGTTAGSLSVEKGGAALRRAAAELRSRLLALAAEDLGAPADRLTISDGALTDPTGNSTTYWALAGGSDTLGAKAPDTAVGESVRRWDLGAKFMGEPSFIQDLDLPGMVHGRVVRPPSATARLVSLDGAATAGLPGVIEVVQSGSFVGVVAELEEQAIRAANRLRNISEWDDRPPASTNYGDPRYLLDEDSRLQVATEFDDRPSATRLRSLSATYTRPFLAHASIGPSCAIALSQGSRMTVWSHTQGVYGLRKDLATVLGLAEEEVRVIHMEGAGCYGHNGADDVALDAALLARELPGRPVRLQWSREDEFAWEPYSSAMVIELRAAVDDEGQIVEWSHDGWSHTHSSRPGSVDGVALLAAHHLEDPFPLPGLRPVPLPAGGGLRNAVPLYDIPQLAVVGHFVPDGPVRTSALRSLGAQANLFAIESFMDELAALAKSDPVQFRLRHLSDRRARDVIEAVVERANVAVGGQDEHGHGYGLGFAQYKNTSCYVAVIAEVEAEHEVRLVRAWAVVDAGLVVNPDGVRNQIEGGIIQAASWTLKERVTLEGDRPATRGWLDYPILTFQEVPELDVHIIERPGEPSVGVGEGAAGPTTAAIANGLRAALGVPVRDLPLTPDRVMKAILEG